uniref:Large ribosomal subunit protein bL9c n=1 Tax=Flintiella sanguinaria TaxID=101926 RepID=A0A1X9PUE4_9RHOD|nr:50S ribosomal protein L9 [Flintiella sanguinaria]
MVKKMIEVLLRQDIKKLGKSGEVKTVAFGYARNYLIPFNYACKVTPNILHRIKKELEESKKQLLKIREGQLNLKQSIESIGKVTIRKKVGQNNLIFGSVNDRDIVNSIKSNLGETIDRKSIIIPEIKELGSYEIEIILNTDIVAKLQLQVIPE